MPSALILYQYFYPDDVVSSVHLTELAEGLVCRGWRVTSLPCNRSCRDPKQRYPRHETHNGVDIERIWRPPFPQAATWGRLANSAWMIAAWSLRALIDRPDILIVGTDPVLSVVTAIPWKWIRSRTRTIHWCFDLYPEAAEADGLLRPGAPLSFLRRLARAAYHRFDLIADLGSCMRERLAAYGGSAERTTMPPWALAEPAEALPIDAKERRTIFGEASLGILYSGSVGRAHSHCEMLTLARALRGDDIHFAFSIRGNRATEVHKDVTTADTNISFVPFAAQECLEARLSAPDIHVVSLRSEWTGTVVPSKFFGALAAGRPVLFLGDERCSLADIIRRHRVGWVCSPGREATVALQLRTLAQNPDVLSGLRAHCHHVYQTYFARDLLLDAFADRLRFTSNRSVKETEQESADQASLST